MFGGPVPAHQDSQVVLEPGSVLDDYIPEPPRVGLDMLIESHSACSSDPFTIEPIGTFATVFGLPSTVEQISPSSIVFAGDSGDGSPRVHQRSSLFLMTRTLRRLRLWI
ncbi:hypothetical protein HN51_026003 [Arachis hypogaea]